MKLLVEELKTTLSQDFSLSLQTRKNISAVRPHIVLYNAPAGTFTLSLMQSSIVLGSQTFTSASLRSLFDTSDDYLHGYPKIEFTNPVLVKEGSYTLKLSSSGYTFSNSAYIAWVKRHENLFYKIDGGVPEDDANLPLTFELWAYKKQNRII